jgi:hypothetical protein
MFRINFVFHAIGDQVCTTGVPENLHNATGQPSYITDKKIWAFKYNPYVKHVSESELPKEHYNITLIPDARVPEQARKYQDSLGCAIAGSQTEYMLAQLGVTEPRLRHPRLYIYEDIDIKPNKVVIHTTGSDRTKAGEPAVRPWAGEDDVRILSDSVLESIKRNYKDYEIIQVGGANDKPMPNADRDLRGKLDYWGTAREIAEAAVFIGVLSGPMHIANCYPRTMKKIVLQEFPESSVRKWRPGDTRNFSFTWIDPNSTYYNKFDYDAGISFSHTKI